MSCVNVKYVKPKNRIGEAYSTPPGPLTEISNILFKIITEMFRGKAILNL